MFQTYLFPSLAVPLQTLAVMSPTQLEVWLRKKLTETLFKVTSKPRLPTLENVVSGVPKEFDGSI